ncbi:MAG: hypothetical protein LBE13_07575 [Bacteroidales bacterium]|jgi:hypothetical protein|nr:hypothetical protein [Bacteroidales bacterium]
MFSAKEKDRLLKKICMGDFDDPNYNYVTSDNTERQMCRILNKDGYVRRSDSENETYCFLTDKGNEFISRGGYTKQYYCDLLKNNKTTIISVIALIVAVLSYIRGCR